MGGCYSSGTRGLTAPPCNTLYQINYEGIPQYTSVHTVICFYSLGCMVVSDRVTSSGLLLHNIIASNLWGHQSTFCIVCDRHTYTVRSSSSDNLHRVCSYTKFTEYRSQNMHSCCTKTGQNGQILAKLHYFGRLWWCKFGSIILYGYSRLLRGNLSPSNSFKPLFILHSPHHYNAVNGK